LNLSKYIEEDLISRKDLPKESEGIIPRYDAEKLSYLYHQGARHLVDLIKTQQIYYKLQFSKHLLYDSILNGMNGGFSFAGGVSALYQYFQKKEKKRFSLHDLLSIL